MLKDISKQEAKEIMDKLTEKFSYVIEFHYKNDMFVTSVYDKENGKQLNAGGGLTTKELENMTAIEFLEMLSQFDIWVDALREQINDKHFFNV